MRGIGYETVLDVNNRFESAHQIIDGLDKRTKLIGYIGGIDRMEIGMPGAYVAIAANGP